MNQRLCDKFQVYEDVSIQYPTSNEPITNQEKHSFDGILVSERLIEAKVEVAVCCAHDHCQLKRIIFAALSLNNDYQYQYPPPPPLRQCRSPTYFPKCPLPPKYLFLPVVLTIPSRTIQSPQKTRKNQLECQI